MLEYLLHLLHFILSDENPQNNNSEQIKQSRFDLYSNQLGEYANSGSPGFQTPAILLDFKENNYKYQLKNRIQRAELQFSLYIITKLKDEDNNTWPSACKHTQLIDETLSCLNNYKYKELPDTFSSNHNRLNELQNQFRAYNIENDIKIEATSTKEWEYPNTRINIIQFKVNVDAMNSNLKTEQTDWIEKDYSKGSIISIQSEGKKKLYRATQDICKGDSFEKQIQKGVWEIINKGENQLKTTFILR